MGVNAEYSRPTAFPNRPRENTPYRLAKAVDETEPVDDEAFRFFFIFADKRKAVLADSNAWRSRETKAIRSISMSVDPYLKHQFGLEGQKALVTGGASGIGQAIAIALAKAGADVGITVHSRSGDETLAMIKRAGRSGLSIATDLAALDAAGADLLIGKAGYRIWTRVNSRQQCRHHTP